MERTPERLGAHYQRYSQPIYNEYNQTQYQQNDYNSAYTVPQQLSTQQEPNIEYENVDYYLTVSSKDRDTTQHPSESNYVINFQQEFKNIHSVELIQAIVPDKNDVTNEPYLLLQIEELENFMISVDRNVSDAFAILQLCRPTTPGTFIQIDKRIHENVVKYFKTPKSTLARMSIKVTDCDGGLFDFGGTSSSNKEFQNTFVFKIVCLEKKRSTLAHRNVF
jgi:hypothetical protein